MAFIKQYSPATRVNHEELEGAMRLLADLVEEHDDDFRSFFYFGAYATLDVIEHNEHVEYPKDFVAVLDRKLSEVLGDE